MQSLALVQQQRLRVWTPDDAPGDGSSAAGGDFSPRMTLSQFYRTWFLPIVLQAKSRSENTVTGYDESIDWWIRLTGDPPLVLLDEFTIAGFETQLRQATYRRGKTGRDRPLTEFTVAKHLQNIDAVLYRVGPKTHPKRPTKQVIDCPPRILVEKPVLDEPKPSFSIDVARSIVGATSLMYRDQLNLFTWLLALYYLGLRTGTVGKLELDMAETRPGGIWLRVPKAIVKKTHKGLTKYVHPLLWEAIQRLVGSRRRRSGPIFQIACSYSHLVDLHYELQRLAGVPVREQMSPQAWRRTHSTQMASIGLAMGRKIAQRSLDHEDDAVTRQHYVDLEPELIRRLPPIADGVIEPLQRRLF